MDSRLLAAYDAAGETLAGLRRQGGDAAQIKALQVWRDQGENSLRAVAGVLDTLATKLEMTDAAPTQGQRAVYADYKKRLDALLARR